MLFIGGQGSTRRTIRSLRCVFINALGFIEFPNAFCSKELPHPGAVSAFAMIADSEEFQERCQGERRRLGAGSVSTTVGDGAKWIWNLTQKVFGKTEECLDIFHALEHISDCGKELYGVSEETTIWFERMREGRVIGSGMVEGACKNLVGRRLKQTGACWRVDRVNKIAVIVAAIYSNQWNALWKIPTKV